MEIITSKSNKHIKLCKDLQDKKFRKKSGLCLLEGIKIVRECVKNGLEITQIITTKDGYNEVIKEFFGKEIIVVSNDLLKYISSTVSPQSVVGIAKVNKLEYQKPKTNYLLLDNIQDPSNLGAIVRTAVATGFTTIYLIDCVDEYNEKVIRASMGNLFKCKFFHIGLNQVDELKDSLYICDMNGKNIFNKKEFSQIIGLCIGNEGHGVSQEIREKISNIISIPMLNEVESLNAAVSASIIMYQVKVNQKEI